MFRLKKLIVFFLILIILLIGISYFLMKSAKIQKYENVELENVKLENTAIENTALENTALENPELEKDYNEQLNVVDTSVEVQNMKILVIEINPILNAIKDNIYSNNGNPKVSEYLQKIGEEKTAINEMIEDLEYASNGYLKITTKWEYLNEYPTYNQAIRLKNGTTAYRLDEETYLDMIGYNSNTKGEWYNLLNSQYYTQIPGFSFDYNYIMQKFDLINRRNQGEFDQVWLCTIDPSSTFETMMVGRTAYWVNGTPIQADCDNFIIANVTIARRDANLHALGHSAENILKNTFSMKYDSYSKDSISINSQQELDSLNLWERYCLTDYNSIGDYASVGNVHFPFNASDGYNYDNKSKVYSSWRDWLNYPNLTGEKQLDDSNAWLLHEANANLDEDENKDSDRLFMRFWFSLFPNQSGYYKDGHLNNWWKYFYSLDYIEEIINNDDLNKNVNVGEEIKVDFNLKYQSQKIEKVNTIYEDNNVQISNKNVIDFSNNKLIAKNPGTSTLTLNYDGKSVQYIVNVK